MKVYKCDACGSVIEDPYKVKMKEFFIGVSSEVGGVFPDFRQRKVKVHLCDKCYHNLKKLALESESKDEKEE